MIQITVHDQEFHTIIAALRYYQEQGLGNPANRPDEIHALATNAHAVWEEGDVTSLDDEGIDALVERINCEYVDVPEEDN